MSTTYGSFLQWVTAIIKKHEDGDLDDRKWMLRVNGTLTDDNLYGWKRDRGDKEVEHGLNTLRTYIRRSWRDVWEGHTGDYLNVSPTTIHAPIAQQVGPVTRSRTQQNGGATILPKPVPPPIRHKAKVTRKTIVRAKANKPTTPKGQVQSTMRKGPAGAPRLPKLVIPGGGIRAPVPQTSLTPLPVEVGPTAVTSLLAYISNALGRPSSSQTEDLLTAKVSPTIPSHPSNHNPISTTVRPSALQMIITPVEQRPPTLPPQPKRSNNAPVVLSRASSSFLPLPPVAHRQGSKRSFESLTAIRPLTQYSTTLLRNTIQLHENDVRRVEIAQLAMQQTIIRSLEHLAVLKADVEYLQKQIQAGVNGGLNNIEFDLEVARTAMKQQRDQVIQLRACERRYAITIARAKIDMAALEAAIKYRTDRFWGTTS